jgi:hypothetical protein
MKQRLPSILIILLSLLLHGAANGQEELIKIRRMIIIADSVILTSHTATPEIITAADDPKNTELVLNGKINYAPVKERKQLQGSAIIHLANTLTKPFADKKVEQTGCFTPKHAIFIVKKSEVSFINVCFDCREISSSADISFPHQDFDTKTWEKLNAFFLQLGFTWGFDNRQ